MPDPAWLTIALKDIGIAEIPGPTHNTRIIEYNKHVKYGSATDEEAWCAKAMNCWLEEAGFKGTNSPAARSFMSWGQPLHSPVRGCLVVYWRDKPDGWTGHVHLYLAENDTQIKGLGGNQGNKVSEGWYPKDRVLGFRWPSGVAVPASDVPPLIPDGMMLISAGALRQLTADLQTVNAQLGAATELAKKIAEAAK